MSSGGIGNAVSSVLSFTILGQLFKTKAPKPTTQRIGELSNQTAKEGEPRPIVWGRVRPISGNIMHSSTPRIITREVQGQSSGGGKGGKKKPPKQYEERVLRTYAIRICEGPITAIIRVWRNNKLVYDARGNAWGAKNNGVFLSRARFYLGAWTQLPDPTLESQWGAGNVPAYRGTCYMIVPDEDLTDLGGAVPQYIYEVERAEGVALTSLLYDVEYVESSDSSAQAIGIRSPLIQAGAAPDEIVSVGAFQSISFSAKLINVNQLETVDSAVSISGVSFRKVLNQYEQHAESLDSYTMVSSISNRVALIAYGEYPEEQLNSFVNLEGISHASN